MEIEPLSGLYCYICHCWEHSHFLFVLVVVVTKTEGGKRKSKMLKWLLEQNVRGNLPNGTSVPVTVVQQGVFPQLGQTSSQLIFWGHFLLWFKKIYSSVYLSFRYPTPDSIAQTWRTLTCSQDWWGNLDFTCCLVRLEGRHAVRSKLAAKYLGALSASGTGTCAVSPMMWILFFINRHKLLMEENTTCHFYEVESAVQEW